MLALSHYEPSIVPYDTSRPAKRIIFHPYSPILPPHSTPSPNMLPLHPTLITQSFASLDEPSALNPPPWKLRAQVLGLLFVRGPWRQSQFAPQFSQTAARGGRRQTRPSDRRCLPGIAGIDPEVYNLRRRRSQFVMYTRIAVGLAPSRF